MFLFGGITCNVILTREGVVLGGQEVGDDPGGIARDDLEGGHDKVAGFEEVEKLCSCVLYKWPI